MKSDLALLFILALLLVLVVYYVGTVSDLLAFAKAGQQIGYFLTGRDSSGNYRKVGSVGPGTKAG